MNKIFYMVLQYKRRGNFESFEDSQALINDMGFKKPNPNNGNSTFPYNTSKSKVCTRYGNTGHTIEVCHHKLRFPPHFGKASMTNNTTTNDGDDDGITSPSLYILTMVLLQLLKTNLRN